MLIRIGANDRTVHPFFTRRMYRVLAEEGINVTYHELADKEHWWWDTRYVTANTDILECALFLSVCLSVCLTHFVFVFLCVFLQWFDTVGWVI